MPVAGSRASDSRSTHSVRPRPVIPAKRKLPGTARGVPSPNRADALVLSFAFPVVKRNPLDAYRNDRGARGDYDPYRAMR